MITGQSAIYADCKYIRGLGWWFALLLIGWGPWVVLEPHSHSAVKGSIVRRSIRQLGELVVCPAQVSFDLFL